MRMRGFFFPPLIPHMQSFWLLHTVCFSATSLTRAKTAFIHVKRVYYQFNFLIFIERIFFFLRITVKQEVSHFFQPNLRNQKEGLKQGAGET